MNLYSVNNLIFSFERKIPFEISKKYKNYFQNPPLQRTPHIKNIKTDVLNYFALFSSL